MNELNLDNMKHIESKKCHYCKVELTDDNKSLWSSFDMIEDKQVTVDQCVTCFEIRQRELCSCERVGDTFVPTKTRDEILIEIQNEKLDVDTLKAIEESHFAKMQ